MPKKTGNRLTCQYANKVVREFVNGLLTHVKNAIYKVRSKLTKMSGTPWITKGMKNQLL